MERWSGVTEWSDGVAGWSGVCRQQHRQVVRRTRRSTDSQCPPLYLSFIAFVQGQIVVGLYSDWEEWENWKNWEDEEAG